MSDKMLYENEWLSLVERDGWYIFARESRCQDSQIVAIVPFTTDKFGDIDQILGRFEECPAHSDGVQLCSITGGVDHGDNPVDAVLKELDEEGGFQADADMLISLGTIRPISSSEATVHLYAIDVTGMEDMRREESKGDGTKGEEGAYCDWVSLEDALMCKSANMLSCLARLLLLENE